jgi:serine/threonine-protein kinase
VRAARPTFRPVQIGADLGRHAVVEELGSGGMATVFRARDRELRRDVAIKVLFPHLCRNREVVSRFQREARAAAALDHPHILRVFDVGGGAPAAEQGADAGPVDPPYMVLELVRGPSLDQIIAQMVARGGPPLAEIVAACGVALCGALAHAHRAGVIHRDVKPGNVLVADGGRLVLGDFGVARVADDDSSVITRTGALLGTPAFMSPEQATGAELDARSDLYSLGATLYQMATGSLPVSGSAARAVAQIVAGEVVPPLRRNPGMGSDLARVIERLMRVDRGQRHADAGEAEAALRDIAARAGREPEDLLRDFFAEPDACQARLLPEVVSASVAEARTALGAGDRVRALALADRALALDGDCRAALDLVDGIGRGRARKRAVVAALAVAVAGAMTWGALSLWPADPGTARLARGSAGQQAAAAPEQAGMQPALPSSAPSGAAIDAGTVAFVEAGTVAPVATEPSRTAPAPAASPDAQPPATSRSKSAPRATRRRRDREPEQPPAPSTPDAGAPVPAAVAPPPAMAVVTLEMDSWCDVKVGALALGTANPKLTFKLPAGSHLLTCAREEGQQPLRWSRRVTLAPGEKRTERGRILPAVSVRVALSRGDAVRLRLAPKSKILKGGTKVEVPAGRVRVELLDGGQPIASDWVTFTPGSPCTLKDDPAIACY